MTRKCRTCGNEKNEQEFHVKNKQLCIICFKVDASTRHKIYRETHKKELYEKKKLYLEKNKEKTNEYQKKYREDNKEINAQQRKLYYKRNKEKILQERKIYYTNNKDTVRERVKTYAKTDKGIEVRKSAIKKYYDSKPEKKEEYGIRHFITFVIKPKILFRDEYTCQLCNCKDAEFHCHHIIPASIAPDKIEDTTNLITLCQDCHTKAHMGDWQKIDLEIQKLLLENKTLQKELQWENISHPASG